MIDVATWRIEPERIAKTVLKMLAILGLLWWALVILAMGMIAGDTMAQAIGLGMIYAAYCFALLWIARLK